MAATATETATRSQLPSAWKQTKPFHVAAMQAASGREWTLFLCLDTEITDKGDLRQIHGKCKAPVSAGCATIDDVVAELGTYGPDKPDDMVNTTHPKHVQLVFARKPSKDDKGRLVFATGSGKHTALSVHVLMAVQYGLPINNRIPPEVVEVVMDSYGFRPHDGKPS